MKVLYQIRLYFSYLILLSIIGFAFYLLYCALTKSFYLAQILIIFSSLFFLAALLLLENNILKRKSVRYEKNINNGNFSSILNEKIHFFYSSEIKMQMFEYKAICNSILGKYDEAKEMFEKIPYRFFLCNPELTLHSVFYLTLISMIEKNDKQFDKLSNIYIKKEKMLRRYYTEKQMPYFDRRINNPNIMLEEIKILTLINNSENYYKNQVLILFSNHKDTKLYNDIQNI